MPRLSILIPCPGGAADFDGTLVAVLQHRPADCEVLVVHRHEYDDPYGLRGEVRFLQAASEQSLCGLLNVGLAASSAQIVHVLACGLEPQEGWTQPALSHFSDDEVAAVAPAIMHADGRRLAAAGVRMTIGGSRRVLTDRRLLQSGSGHLRAAIGGPTLAAGFYRREVLAALGGFDAAATDRLADVALALDLAALDLRTELEPAARIVATTDSWLTIADRPLALGRAAERLFWRGASRVGLPLALAAHPLAVALDCLREPAQITGLMGRAWALCELGRVRSSGARLAAAAEQLRAVALQRQAIPIARPAAARPAAASQRRRAA